jgi:hypothetical protein
LTFGKEIAAGDTALPSLLRANVTRFAAAKAVTCKQLLDDNAAKPEAERKDPADMIRKFDYWQQTEENTARMRARSAKQWQEFTTEANMKSFPNMRWLRSISQDKRAEHLGFAGRVWAKDDPFWLTNMPGQDWNCKCAMQQTSAPVTEGNDEIETEPVPKGLEGNPAVTGEIFTDKANYFMRLDKLPNPAGLTDRTARDWVDYVVKKEISGTILQEAKDGGAEIIYSDLNSGKLHTGKKSLRRAMNHSIEYDSLYLTKAISEGAVKLENRVYEWLGQRYDMNNPAMRQKVKDKAKRGVIGYNIYKTRFYGKDYDVFMELSKYGYEQLYMVKKK